MSDKDSSDEEIIEILLEDHDARVCRTRIARLERAVTLLARQVGATGWNKPLQDVLDAIQADAQVPWTT